MNKIWEVTHMDGSGKEVGRSTLDETALRYLSGDGFFSRMCAMEVGESETTRVKASDLVAGSSHTYTRIA